MLNSSSQFLNLLYCNIGQNLERKELILTNKAIFIGIIIFSVVILIGSYFLFANDQSASKINFYSSKDKERPVAEVKETIKDFGKIKVSDDQIVIFTLKNAGNKHLQLSGISSSCGCTAAQLIYKGVTSKEYSMHFQEKDIYQIDSQTEAKVKVIYRPSTMPVYGPVEREVYITTNDPNNSKLIFRIKAVVN